MARSLPPGPRTPIRTLLRLNSGLLAYLDEIGREYGPVIYVPVAGHRAFLLNEPELIKEFFSKHRSFVKDLSMRTAKKLLGEGLLVSEGEFHKRQRRMSAPAFHQDRIAAYATRMVDSAIECHTHWQDGVRIDADEAMHHLTLRIVGRTLFGTDVESEVEEIGEALTAARQRFTILRLAFVQMLDRLPLPVNHQWTRSRERLDRVMDRMIDARRRSRMDSGDLLSMLLMATDSEGDGTHMSEVQLRDEAITILLAGHETTASTLAWSWYLLAQNPEIEARLHRELDETLNGGTPTLADVKKLTFTEHVIAETMRLYPPAWGVGRIATEDVEIGGYTVRRGEMVVASQWLVHRNPRFYPEPHRFDPDRWEPARAAARPRFAYFPFGGGPRSCIGEGYAWMECVLVLATLAQQWQLRLVPGTRVEPDPRFTLRPKHGMPMTLARRAPAPAAAAG